MAKQKEKRKLDPVWLHPDRPECFEYYKKECKRLAAEVKDLEKPKTLSFTLADVELGLVEEVIRIALELTGEVDPSKALFHICSEYLTHGPHARAYDSMSVRKEILGARLEDLMAEAGEEEVKEIAARLYAKGRGGKGRRR